jgi:hypothetical protein
MEVTTQDASRLFSLGLALGNSPLGSRFANLARAIACCEAALRVYTEANFPQDWAATQFNLALTLAALKDQEGARRAIQNAVVGYRRVGMERKAQDAVDWLTWSGKSKPTSGVRRLLARLFSG